MVRLVENAGAGRELAVTLPIVGAKLKDQPVRHGYSLRSGSWLRGSRRGQQEKRLIGRVDQPAYRSPGVQDIAART